jgi:hypothetical protein
LLRCGVVALQRCRIRGFKENFNDKLKAAIKDKSSVIDKLDEKKSRLAEIREACDLFLFPFTSSEKLEVDDQYGLVAAEEGRQLEVLDREISAPKYLSAAERAAKEAEEAEEAARKAAAGSDDAVGRALNDMMYGTLEARKQDEHNIFEEKPAFYDTPLEQLTDDQIKQCKEYDRKEKAVRDAEETQRKALEVLPLLSLRGAFLWQRAACLPCCGPQSIWPCCGLRACVTHAALVWLGVRPAGGGQEDQDRHAAAHHRLSHAPRRAFCAQARGAAPDLRCRARDGAPLAGMCVCERVSLCACAY